MLGPQEVDGEILHRSERGMKHFLGVETSPYQIPFKTLRESRSWKAQRGQYLLAMGLDCYNYHISDEGLQWHEFRMIVDELHHSPRYEFICKLQVHMG